MVAICAGCDRVYAWGAVIIGAIAGPLMVFLSWAVIKMKIDDPLDAFAVHAGGGAIGLLLTPFFWKEYGLFFGNPEVKKGEVTAAQMLGRLLDATLVACLIAL